MKRIAWKDLFREIKDFLVIVAAVVVFLWLAPGNGLSRFSTNSDDPKVMPTATVFIADEYPSDNISDWAVGEDAIYVYYRSHSRVDVFDKEGSYSFSIAITDYSNGVGGVGVKDGLLYVADEHSNIYVFDGRNCISVIPKGSGQKIDIDKLGGKEGYRLKLGRIIDIETNNVLLDLRVTSVYLNYLGLFLIIIPVIIKKIVDKKKGKRKSVYGERIDPITGEHQRYEIIRPE